MSQFAPFPKVPRLDKPIVVTEKIDGTNGQIHIEMVVPRDGSQSFYVADPRTLLDSRYDADTGTMWLLRAGSRTRYLSREQDNFGFAAWATRHSQELFKLGPGRHFGEWYGQGIQRGYGLNHRRFALFNVSRWVDTSVWTDGDEARTGKRRCPPCCTVVPVLAASEGWTDDIIERALEDLRLFGSSAVRGYLHPEGVMVYHSGSNSFFKLTLDDSHKGERP